MMSKKQHFEFLIQTIKFLALVAICSMVVTIFLLTT